MCVGDNVVCVSMVIVCVCVSEMHQAVQHCYDANELHMKKIMATFTMDSRQLEDMWDLNSMMH